MKKTLCIFAMMIAINVSAQNRIVLGYFPTWSETWASEGQNSRLREVPDFITHLFLSFAKPNLTYVEGSYDISGTGIEVPYDGCALLETISVLKQRGIKVILSVGGETYWNQPGAYNIDYAAIKSLVDDLGFAGVDWDFEPNGSFSDIGSSVNVNHYIDFITQTRALMPASDGYLIACAPSGVGALGGQLNDDVNSPYRYDQRNTLTGESDAQLYQGTASTNGINLFGYSATGHMIPVLNTVGSMIDIVAYQGYNLGGSQNRSIMYDAYAYYANIYGFSVAAGIHFPNEPWGPYYTYTLANTASLSSHILNHPDRINTQDGIMIWQMLLENSTTSAYSYLYTAKQVFDGTNEGNAVAQSGSWSTQAYSGGGVTCSQLSVQENEKDDHVTVLLSEQGLHVYTDASLEIHLYEWSGKEIFSQKISNPGEFLYSIDIQEGIYLIKTTFGSQKIMYIK